MRYQATTPSVLASSWTSWGPKIAHLRDAPGFGWWHHAKRWMGRTRFPSGERRGRFMSEENKALVRRS
jgi:hypothetical protein